jgi:demethylmenaquinone methyltransferase/2-methoxy-6-polyprenyl-1,4-benzoquinol methylase
VDADTSPDHLLGEQISYYRAIAGTYGDYAIAPVATELIAALDRFGPTGRVLELACGPGVWTPQLLQHASSVTMVDAAPEMLAIARTRVAGCEERVRMVQADLFAWTPDDRYDVVFFGFWLSHVPEHRFDSFWALVARCLAPRGRVFFIDDAYRTADELIEGERSSTIQRRVKGGPSYRIVKVPHRPAQLESRLRRLGWRIEVNHASEHFYWGAGGRLLATGGGDR